MFSLAGFWMFKTVLIISSSKKWEERLICLLGSCCQLWCRIILYWLCARLCLGEKILFFLLQLVQLSIWFWQKNKLKETCQIRFKIHQAKPVAASKLSYQVAQGMVFSKSSVVCCRDVFISRFYFILATISALVLLLLLLLIFYNTCINLSG